MVFNDDILFIHAPKTAGMSMTKLLVPSLKGQVNVTGPYKKKKREGNVVYWPGKRHETLYDAESFLSYFNKSIHYFEKIFVVMRNPYDLELSRYSYLRKGYKGDRGLAQEIAMNGTFKEYLQKAPFFGMFPPRLNIYYSLNWYMPENLNILKFENLGTDIKVYMAEYFKGDYKLGNENVSEHPLYHEVYDNDLEESCYKRHKWFFEKGFYSREQF